MIGPSVLWLLATVLVLATLLAATTLMIRGAWVLSERLARRRRDET